MDILSLSNSMGERAIRWLYAIALILIALSVVFGVWRGGMTMTRVPRTPPVAAASADAGAQPQAMAPQATDTQAQPGARGMRPGMRSGMRGPGFHRRGMMGMRMMRRNPQLFGGLMIIRALLRGLIALLIVRTLAEIGLKQLRRA